MKLKEKAPCETQGLDTLKQRTEQMLGLCVKEHMWLDGYLLQRKHFHFREFGMQFGRGHGLSLHNSVQLASENSFSDTHRRLDTAFHP